VSLLNAEVDLLRRIPMFAGIESSRLKLLAYTSDVVTYQASQVLFKKGDVGDAAYVIIKGDAEVVIASDTGEIPIAILRDGALVGEIAILCDTPRTATVRAKGELKALRIRKEPFFELLHQFPEMAVEMTRLLAVNLTKTTERLADTTQRLTRCTAELAEAQRTAHN
jgi:CRP/FNR family transcriptional regulator, cyclic AMP receptor protein